MASIRHEIAIDASPQHVWDVIRDVGAVHERLLPGRVAETRIDGVQRFLTFPDGHVIRELVITIDDESRRLVYSVVEGARPALDHHHASFEVRAEGRGARLIWTTDVLPDDRAPEIRIRTGFGIAEMKQAIEASASDARPRTDATAVYLITGIQAAGKSTVAQALAERLPKSAHVRGDVFRRSVISGRADMSPAPSAEAMAQLRLRHRLAAQAADGYAAAGITAIVQDVVLGDMLPYFIDHIRTDPLYVVVLAPSPAAVAQREAARPKTAYGTFTVADLDTGLRESTPRLGLWLDTSDLTVAQTVDEILTRAEPFAR